MADHQEDLRTFIAVELPEHVKVFLSKLASDLKKCGADAKWVRPEAMHLTLKFLGNIPAEAVERIDAGVSGPFSAMTVIPLRIQGVGAFPGIRNPRVVWAGVSDPDGRLRSIASLLDDILDPLGFPREKRAFTPHLTLARVRSQRGTADLTEELRQREGIIGPEFRAERAVFFQSILKPAGAEYRPLRRFDFKEA